MSKKRESGHSAQVQMRLLLNGCSLPIAQLGPDFLILRDPFDHPPSEAEIMLRVDGHEEQWRVYLPHGLQTRAERQPLAKI